MFAAEIRRKRAWQLRSSQQCRWHLDAVFVKIRRETPYLRRAVDHEGEALGSIVTKTRDRRAVLHFLRKLIRRYGRPKQLITDRFCGYGAALRELDLADDRARPPSFGSGGGLVLRELADASHD